MEPARAGLHKILTDILRRAPAEDAALLAWRVVSGSHVGSRTTPLDFRDGVLRVEVPDTSWQTNLQGFVPAYLHALNDLLGHKAERILFVLPGTVKKSA